MATNDIRRLRIWILFLSIVGLISLVICLATSSGTRGTEWFCITTTAILTLAYIYSIKGKTVFQGFLRACMVFILSGLVVASSLIFSPYMASCGASNCPPCEIYEYVLLATAFFVLVDMCWTLWDGRSRQHNESQAYKEDPNVLIISPKQPQGSNTQVSPPHVYSTQLEQLGQYHITVDQLRGPQSLETPQPVEFLSRAPQVRETPQLSELLPRAPQVQEMPKPVEPVL